MQLHNPAKKRLHYGISFPKKCLNNERIWTVSTDFCVNYSFKPHTVSALCLWIKVQIRSSMPRHWCLILLWHFLYVMQWNTLTKYQIPGVVGKMKAWEEALGLTALGGCHSQCLFVWSGAWLHIEPYRALGPLFCSRQPWHNPLICEVIVNHYTVGFCSSDTNAWPQGTARLHSHSVSLVHTHCLSHSLTFPVFLHESKKACN